MSLALLLTGLTASAAGNSVPDVLQSFYRTFQNAQDVNWTTVDDLLRIGFTLDGHRKFAYYSNDELVVVATQIGIEDLPADLREQLQSYKDYQVSQLYRLVSGKTGGYCAVLDKGSKHVVLKGKNRWKVYMEERR